VGVSGTILKTTNGGDYRTTRLGGNTNLLASVYFIDKNIGWAVCGYPDLIGLIFYAANGGMNWVSQSSDITRNLWSVHFNS
jgi:photosystem II stability/assembly factor-like uncharacterized protein